ncbi:MAG: hypothetical protein ACKVZJ_10860 [Phycisphaerales bacterium]
MAKKTVPPEEYPSPEVVAPKGDAVRVAMSWGLFFYNRARDDIGAVWRAGWRPALGFAGVWVGLFAFWLAPVQGIEVDEPATLGFLTLVFVQALARSVEKHMNARIPAAG